MVQKAIFISAMLFVVIAGSCRASNRFNFKDFEWFVNRKKLEKVMQAKTMFYGIPIRVEIKFLEGKKVGPFDVVVSYTIHFEETHESHYGRIQRIRDGIEKSSSEYRVIEKTMYTSRWSNAEHKLILSHRKGFPFILDIYKGW